MSKEIYAYTSFSRRYESLCDDTQKRYILFPLLIRQVHDRCGTEAQAGFFIDATLTNRTARIFFKRLIYFMSHS